MPVLQQVKNEVIGGRDLCESIAKAGGVVDFIA